MTGTSPARELDIIVYGASGFVGKLLADYLVKHAPEGTKIGLGGRSSRSWQPLAPIWVPPLPISP